MNQGFTKRHRAIGCVAAWMGFILMQVYSLISWIGRNSLQNEGDAIGAPYLALMAIILIVISTLLLVNMVIVLEYSNSTNKVNAIISLALIIIVTAMTSGVNYSILVASSLTNFVKPAWFTMIIPYQWPSLAYALDLLAWDWFYGLAMIIGSTVFQASREERILRMAMIISGGLSVFGIILLPFAIGPAIGISILGWGVAGSVVSLLMAIVFGRTQPEN